MRLRKEANYDLAFFCSKNQTTIRQTIIDHLQVIITKGGWKLQYQPSQNESTSVPTTKDPLVKQSSTKFMRIPEDRVDTFLTHIGELVTIGEMYSHFQTNLSENPQTSSAAVTLRRINESYSTAAQALQQGILQLRKVPMNTILQRVPKIIRDIASSKNKEIETIVQGGDLLVDKSLVEMLESPLIHMVRNAADHGIEMPSDRQLAGKPTKGQVTIQAYENSESIFLSIQDDGKGLNYQALTQKAEQLGIIKPNQALSEQDIISLLFISGVSTASEVSEISGRGVGMDVVKRAIDDLGGKISVESSLGNGSLFVIQLPKTISTQIFDGYIVVLNNNRYVFPLKSVLRCIPVKDTVIVNVAEKGECAQIDNQLLTVVHLNQVYSQEIKQRHPDAIFVVIETKTQRIAVEVDQVEGVRQVVLKSINGITDQDHVIFTGGAIMGDGSVAVSFPKIRTVLN